MSRRFSVRLAFVIPFLWGVGVARESSGQRRIVDVEPITFRRDIRDNGRTSLATAGASYGFSDEATVIPYVGGGIGILPLQARLGLFFVPSGLEEDGLVARIELRPSIPVIPCAEPALFANAGLGYRWQLESGPRGAVIGPGLYVMPAFEGGPAWIKPGCTEDGAPDVPFELTFFFGGTVALGLDF